MREVTNDYISQVKSGARQFGFYVNVYGNGTEPETLWLSDIISVEITRSASDQLQIGACMSDRLTLRTKATTLFNGRGKKVVVYYRCTAPILGWIRLGTFYVDECVTDRGVTAVTAYDMMSRLDKRISWGATSRTDALIFPCSMQDMLEYICARVGVTTDFVCQNITIEKPPDGYTARELISYIAASHGANARFSPSEVLRIRTYTQTAEIIQYGGCYSMDIASDGGFTAKGILFDRGGDDTIYIDGTASEYDEDADGVVEAYNPFATVGIAEYAWGVLGGLSYSAVSLEMPAQNILEPGDMFTVQGADGTEKTAIVMEQTLSVSCTGGFVEAISCTADSKNQTRNAENRAAAAEKEIQSSAGSALTENEYLTDLSVKYNGITYTAEKDADTGLISRISDSNGNEFKPKINSGITDIGMHNAVFWAVAMIQGFADFMSRKVFTSGKGLASDYLWTQRAQASAKPTVYADHIYIPAFSNKCILLYNDIPIRTKTLCVELETHVENPDDYWGYWSYLRLGTGYDLNALNYMSTAGLLGEYCVKHFIAGDKGDPYENVSRQAFRIDIPAEAWGKPLCIIFFAYNCVTNIYNIWTEA